MITLGIIGVVAALTLPTLIQNHKKQALKSQLHKVFNNAISMAVAQEGVSDFCGTKLHDVFGRAGYDCVAGNACQDIDEKIKKYLKYVSVDDEQYTYKTGWSWLPTRRYTHRMILSDGAWIFWSSNSGSACLGCDAVLFHVDLNGPKGPNMLGKDLHELSIRVYNGDFKDPNCSEGPNIRKYTVQKAFDAIDSL